VQAITNTGQQHVTLEPIPAILRQLDSEGYDFPRKIRRQFDQRES
jgi:hypothetical protein